MPFLEDGTPGRRDPQPARRAEPDERRPDPRDPPRLGRGPGLVRRRHRGVQASRRRTTANGRVYVSTPVFDGATVADVDHALVAWQDHYKGAIRMDIDRSRRAGEQAQRQGHALQRPHRRAVRGAGHRRLHVHPEAAAPRRRQDPRALDRPVLARHPAAAGRQGAVRRPALRRDGGLGARGLRRGVHAAGDADDQVRRHGRAREGLRGDRQGREHRRAVDPRVLQGAAQGDAVARRSTSTSSPRRASAPRCATRTTTCCARPRSSASTSPACAPRRTSRRPAAAGDGRGAAGRRRRRRGRRRRGRRRRRRRRPRRGRRGRRARRGGLARRPRDRDRPRCAGTATRTLDDEAVPTDEESA